MDLAGRREKAAKKGDNVALIEIDRERETIEKHLSQAKGIGGRSRTFSDARKRQRETEWKSVRRAVEDLPDALDHLRQHFRATLRTTHAGYRYGPDPPPHLGPLENLQEKLARTRFVRQRTRFVLP